MLITRLCKFLPRDWLSLSRDDNVDRIQASCVSYPLHSYPDCASNECRNCTLNLAASCRGQHLALLNWVMLDNNRLVNSVMCSIRSIFRNRTSNYQHRSSNSSCMGQSESRASATTGRNTKSKSETGCERFHKSQAKKVGWQLIKQLQSQITSTIALIIMSKLQSCPSSNFHYRVNSNQPKPDLPRVSHFNL